MKTITTLTLGFAIGLSTIATPSFAKFSTIDGKKIQQLLPGNSYKVKGSWAGTITYSRNGTYRGNNSKSGNFTGTYKIKGKKLCWENSFGKSKCTSVKFNPENNQIKIGRATHTPQ